MNYKSTTRLPETEVEVSRIIGEAIGTASMCWENVLAAGVFESTRAAELANDTTAAIVGLVGLGEPSLGCATTQQLIDELTARCGDMDYRTVCDGDQP